MKRKSLPDSVSRVMKQSRLSFSSSTSTTSSSSHIFVDLDGVLVDFEAGVRKLFHGRNPESITPRELWPTLARTPDFYANLPWMSDGKLLWQKLLDAGHKPTILTGLPIGKWAEPQKRKWCFEQLSLMSKRVITCKSKEKHLHASTGSILIDDRISLKQAWIHAGGVFIHHTSTNETLKVLREMDLLNAISKEKDGKDHGDEKEAAVSVAVENAQHMTTKLTEATEEIVRDKHEGITTKVGSEKTTTTTADKSKDTKEPVIFDLT